ncbi:hypothetical protein NGC89_08575 [Staphylococcus xylosus]|uniref:hypothetical protein n=1 Tax=Staphylococcus xylosus TaxID=1288 RepID=UPI002DB976FB|nr:hypothetical protein [Staphylococcus xylosus]MEB7801502.1 hypothetical protein [Staphylococcus xylosus]
MPKFNSNFSKPQKLRLENEDFIPTRDEFYSKQIDIDLNKRKEKEITFFNKSVIFSETNTILKFTNFISDTKQQSKINIIHNFSKNLSLLKERISTLDYDDRMLSILSLYLKEETKEISKNQSLVKSDIRSMLDTQDALRVYWFYDLSDDKIKVVCIDPQHLVLPSKHNGKTKNQMIEQTFKETTNSKKHCISKYFQ